VTDWLTQTKRANEIAKSKGQKGAQPFHYERESAARAQTAASISPAAPAPISPVASAAPVKTRKLSFKEQRELDGLPDLIAALETEQKEIADLLADGSLYAIDNARALKLATRSAQIDDELMTALERWEILGSPA
jgi:ATP-binding cassette subfamily F protein uup